MLKNLIVKSDGTEIDSSLILSCTLTQTLNSGQEFTIGSACTDEIEVEYLAQDDNLIAKDDVLTLYWVNDSGTKTKVGIYYCEKPNYQGLMREISGTSMVYKVVAYDTMSKLDADFSGWLRANQAQFPKTIWQLVQLACQRAGVTLASSSLPINGSYSVQAFYADDLTCRQIISWAAEAAGCYAHMNADGRLQFLTYTDKRSTAKITPDGASNSTAYYADSLSYEDYTVKAIEKVQIRQSDSDVGVIYPDSTTATNTYAVQGNLLLTTGTEANLKSVAQNLYNVLKNVTYTPCKVSVPSSSGFACGQIVHVKDARGREFDTYLMSATISSGKASFESVGSASRESSSAVNSQSYKNLTGKMLEIKTSVDGLEVKASDLTGKYTDLKATVDGLSSEVKKDTKITGGGNLILGSESFKNALSGGPGSSVVYGDDGSATINNANTNGYFMFNTAGARIIKGVTLCLSVMYKLISGTDALRLGITFTGDNGKYYIAYIKTADQLEIKQTDGWVLRYGTWTPGQNGVLKKADFDSNDNCTNKFELFHPMLQYGNAPTAWNASSGDYITEKSAKSLITQSAESIKSEVSRTYVTTATVEQAKKDATSDAQSYTDGKLASYSTTEETKSLIQQTADSITQTVEKKLIGGGNLILNTEKMENAVVRGSGGSVAYSVDGSATVTNDASNMHFRFKTVDTTITKGMVMCFSVLYKPVSGTRSLCFSIYFKRNGSNYYASITDANQREIPQTDGWVLRYGTWVPTGNSTLLYVDFGCGSNIAGGDKYTESSVFLHPMLQHGNTPTAWNASSGDYLTQESAKSLFSQTADEIKTEVTNSVTESVTANVKDTATSAANDAVDGKMQDYATSADVELLKESVSSISQKADSITQTVTQRITGGNNIIVGTDDWNNATLDAGGNDLNKKGSYTIDGESVRVTNRAQNTRFHFGADKSLVIAKGMTYCASVLYKLNSGTDSLFLQFETKNSSGAKSYYGNAFKNAKQDIELDNGWKLRWAAFTATADGYADGLFVSTANDNATVTNDLTIMHPMVQMGNAPTAWTASSGDYLTTTETKTEIKQTVNEIKLTASTSGTSSTIKLTAGGTEITSAQINLSGVVTFSDLSTWNQDKTIINGGNITTGQIHNKARTTTYDLDNAWIRMGTEAGERVFLDNRHIAWYATINTGSIGLTGVLYSEAGSSYIGACSKYAKYGWVNGLDPTSYVGMQITYNRSDDSDADFNTTRVGVSGTLNCKNLSAWGSKSRIVSTSFGPIKMAAFETPTPTFADWGRGECGPDGWCVIVPDPRYAETVAQHGQLTWLLTDCDGTGHLWAEDCGQYAIVHGAPGQKFSWMAMATQRGYEGEYAEPSECNYPAPMPEGEDLAAITAARALDSSADAADSLLTDTNAKLNTKNLLKLEDNEA